MKKKVIRSFIQYPFSQLELESEIIAEGEAGFTVRMSAPSRHNRAIPFQGVVILNCLYKGSDKES